MYLLHFVFQTVLRGVTVGGCVFDRLVGGGKKFIEMLLLEILQQFPESRHKQ